MATVLVVDDDTDIARFIEINLRLEGFDVRVAHDGEQAEQSIDEETPDLVLLDVMMPKVDGVELCRRLRANPATANLPVIMLTAKSLSASSSRSTRWSSSRGCGRRCAATRRCARSRR